MDKGMFIDKPNKLYRTLQNILALVREAGRTAEHMVKINRYLKSISDYEVMNQGIEAFFDKMLFPVPATIEADIAYQNSFLKIDAEAILG